MGRNFTSIIVAFIAGLAIIGFVTMLIKNPGGLIISLLMMIGIAFLIFIVLRAVLNRRGSGGFGTGNSDEMKKYRKAVKRSNQKYNIQPKKIKKRKSTGPSSRPLKSKRKSVPYLKVIDGKKSANKENDRASN